MEVWVQNILSPEMDISAPRRKLSPGNEVWAPGLRSGPQDVGFGPEMAVWALDGNLGIEGSLLQKEVGTRE